MVFPASGDYKGRLEQETTVDELKPYAKTRLGSIPKEMALGQVLAYTGATSLTDVTRNVGKYKGRLNELSQLGTDFQGSIVVKRDEPQASLVVLPQEGASEPTKVSTFQEVVRNEKARTGLLSLLKDSKWESQLKGSKLESLKPQLEEPETNVKETLTKALGELEGGYTGSHMKRAIDKVGMPLAEKLGMSDSEKKALNEVSGLYDIGKLGVDESILNFDGKWPDDKAKEWAGKVSNHVHPEIVGPLLEALNVSDLGTQGVLRHHERPNGWTYCKDSDAPSWKEVPKLAKVIGMADTVDAMQWRKANVHRPVEQNSTERPSKNF